MYFSHFIFNKSCDKTIILIHGAYGTAGYWLPYLNMFGNYKIIVLNMNYSTILSTKKSLNDTKHLLQKYLNEHNVFAVLSHSLGTIFTNYFIRDNQVLNFNICSVLFSTRINKEKFKLDLESRLGNKGIEIKTNVNLIRELIDKSKRINSDKIFFFVPRVDDYFIYDFPLDFQKIEFEGDHFEIGNAVNIIAEKMSK